MKIFNTRKTIRILLLGAFSIVIAVLSGCDQGSVGIFATIEAEEKINTRNLVDNASITGLVLGEIGGTNYYFALANTQVFYRSQTGENWNPIGNPGVLLGQFLAGINTDTGDEADEVIYGVFANINAGTYAIYELRSDLTWSSSPVYAPSDVEITGMVGWDTAAASGVLISQNSAGVRTFYSWDGAVTGTPDATHAKDGTVVTNGDDIRDIALSATTAFIVGRQGGAFTLPVAALGSANTDYTLLSVDGAYLRGVGIRSTDDLIAVVDTADSISVSDDNGATWQTIDSGTGRSYTDILWVPQIGTAGAFVVGTETRELENTTRRGYYHATLTGSSGSYDFSMSNDLGDNYDGSDLAVGAIDSFRLFDTNELFALTYGLGLWSTRYVSGSTTPDWTWE